MCCAPSRPSAQPRRDRAVRRALAGEDDNLVLRAARALGPQQWRFTLDKSLPVAAGLGGGSADAAAALARCFGG